MEYRNMDTSVLLFGIACLIPGTDAYCLTYYCVYTLWYFWFCMAIGVMILIGVSVACAKTKENKRVAERAPQENTIDLEAPATVTLTTVTVRETPVTAQSGPQYVPVPQSGPQYVQVPQMQQTEAPPSYTVYPTGVTTTGGQAVQVAMPVYPTEITPLPQAMPQKHQTYTD